LALLNHLRQNQAGEGLCNRPYLEYGIWFRGAKGKNAADAFAEDADRDTCRSCRREIACSKRLFQIMGQY
jgi:hypothetical protein